MKTLVEIESGLSKYIFDDETPLVIGDATIETPYFIIGDLDKNNARLYEQVTAPADWIGNKYRFDGQAWSISPDWSEPESDGSANL